MAENPILILDPGHGGRDPGGGSNSQWLEKNLNLQFSLYQYRRFQELNLPVAITRTTDATLDPVERTRIVKQSGAKYCISNHINSGGGDGAEAIHSIYGGEQLANKIVEEIREEGQNIRRVFTRTLPGDQSLDYYYMHRETGSVNTIIVEYGFADSSKDDVRQLLNEWQSMAEAVVRAFCEYIGHPYRAPGETRDEAPEETLPAVAGTLNVFLDGEQFATAYVIEDRAYVPVRQVTDALGLELEWDAARRRVLLRSEPITD